MVRNVARASVIASGTRLQVVAEQDQVRGADRHVGAGAEGQPEVGRGERGRVVDAVADHRHLVPGRLKAGDDGGLPVRQRPGDDLVDAHRAGDGLRGGLVVAGQQDGVQPERAQLGDGGGGGRLDRVGDREGAVGRAVPGGQHRGAAGVLPRPALRGEVGRDGHALAGEELLAPDQDLAAVDGAARAESRQGRNPSACGSGPASARRGGADRRGDRVLGCLLDRARVTQQLRAADAVGGPHAGQRHPPGGDGSGLVQDHHGDRPGRSRAW